MLELSKLKPLGDEILIEYDYVPESSIIYTKDTSSENQLQWFRVAALGPRSFGVNLDERVAVDWREITNPIDVYNEKGQKVKVGFTKSKSVWAVDEREYS